MLVKWLEIPLTTDIYAVVLLMLGCTLESARELGKVPMSASHSLPEMQPGHQKF